MKKASAIFALGFTLMMTTGYGVSSSHAQQALKATQVADVGDFVDSLFDWLGLG